MSGDSKFFLGVVAAAILVIGGIIFFSSGSSTPQNVTADQLDETVGHKLGPDTAQVKIVEFGDFQCPACAMAAVDFEKAQANNADSVQIIFRHFPLPNHQNGMNGSLAAEAAGAQNKFWPMYDLLYANQQSWEQLDNPLNTYVSYAKDLDLNIDQFKKDYASSETKKTVEADRDYGLALKVDSTPTFYLNKVKFTGVQTAQTWQELIDAAKATPTPAP
ncbi:MAG: thioredoxin domain-containing protein [bacterium]|nr:thioredoxin domain-containing protein [bacterium]